MRPRPPNDGLPPPQFVGQRARPTFGFSVGLPCVVVVKHTMPDGTDILGWELLSDLPALTPAGPAVAE